MNTDISAEEALFFSGHEGALPLYAALRETLFARFPSTGQRAQKTQITFFDRHVFACVSFARVKRKAEMPENFLVLTLGLPAPLNSPRAAVKTEAYPGRWTHHFVLSSPDDLDGEMLRWIAEAHAFAQRKK